MLLLGAALFCLRRRRARCWRSQPFHELTTPLNEEQRTPKPKSALHTAVLRAAEEMGGLFNLASREDDGSDSRFLVTPNEMVFGRPKDAASGIGYYMCVDDDDVRRGMLGGTDAIRSEIMLYGSESDKECLDYVLNREAGSDPTTFQSGLKRDCDEHGNVLRRRQVRTAWGWRSMRLADFVADPKSRKCRLKEAHVVAVRYYTTNGYQSINQPLRNQERFKRKEPHRLPITVAFIEEALGRLREVEADESSRANKHIPLYRGMKNVAIPKPFLKKGGTELAPMSTTSNLKVAMSYSLSAHSVLLRLLTEDFMTRGPDISFLSAFPAEEEFLFPPLTYLSPTGDEETVHVGEATFHIFDVKPRMS